MRLNLYTYFINENMISKILDSIMKSTEYIEFNTKFKCT